MNKPAFFALLALLFELSAAACSSKTSKPALREAGAGEGGVDAGYDAAGPLAVNELLVKRYEDENAVASTSLTVSTPTALVLTAFPKGDDVTVLRQGQAVTQLAERNGFFRVTFADPSDGSRPKMGWIVKYAFEAVDAGVPGTYLAAPWCSGTKVLALQTGRPRCDYVCYKDLECSNGDTCEAAIDLPKNGEVPSTFTYTTVCTPPPDAPPPKRDAGVPSLFGAPHTANGKCPPFTAPAPKLGDLCFMTCETNRNCPEDATCKAAPGTKQKFCFGD